MLVVSGTVTLASTNLFVSHILILNDGIKRLYSCQKMRDDVFSSSTNLRLGIPNWSPGGTRTGPSPWGKRAFVIKISTKMN